MIRIKRPDLKVGEKTKINQDNLEILLIYLGADRFLAFDNRCPHLGCDLSKYGVLIRDELVCQCHFSHFSIFSGKPIKGAAKKPIKIYNVKIDGDYLIIGQ